MFLKIFDFTPPPPQGSSLLDMAGTSMATPVTSGVVALVREYFVKGYYGDGTQWVGYYYGDAQWVGLLW